MSCPPPCPPPWWPRALCSAAGDLPAVSLSGLLALPVRAEGGDIVIGAPSPFRRDVLRRLLPQLRRHASGEAGCPADIRIELALPLARPRPPRAALAGQHHGDRAPRPAAPARPAGSPPAPPAPRPMRRAGGSAPTAGRTAAPLRFNFESFVAGPENELALAAVQSVASGRQPEANPIYLAAAPGMGKSHLVRALVENLRRGGVRGAIYCTAGDFTSQFTQAVRRRDTASFQRHYRSARLLVLEDVQRLPRGKSRATQLELIQTIEHVRMVGGRVVLTGDRMPREIEHFDDSLVSHMASGLVAEMEAPGCALRRAILRDKASRLALRIPDDCLDLLVEHALGSVRDLEGVVKQLSQIALMDSRRRNIDLELTRAALRKITPRAELPLEVEQVIGCICSAYNVSREQLRSKSRTRRVLEARQVAMYLCHHHCGGGASYSRIGRAFNRRHSAVGNAVKKITAQLDRDERLRLKLEEIAGRLKSRRWPPPA